MNPMPNTGHEDGGGIRWGPMQEDCARGKTFYSSFFTGEGVEYVLYDNVKVENESGDPYIGKIMELWQEESTGEKKVLIQWFFKSGELPTVPSANPREVFLAYGKGKGVSNENEVEVICGKCTVLCTSKDARNEQPSEADINNAEFFFSQIYDVDLNQFKPINEVVDQLGSAVVFNKKEWITSVRASAESPKNVKKFECDASDLSNKAHPNVLQDQDCSKQVTVLTRIEASDSGNDMGKSLQLPDSCKADGIELTVTIPKSALLKSRKSRKLKDLKDLGERTYAPKCEKKPFTPMESFVKDDSIKKASNLLSLQRPSEDVFAKSNICADKPLILKEGGISPRESVSIEIGTKTGGVTNGFTKVEAQLLNTEKTNSSLKAKQEDAKRKRVMEASDVSGPSIRAENLQSNKKQLRKSESVKKATSEGTDKEKKNISTSLEVEEKIQTNELVKTFEKRTILKDLTWEEKLDQNIKHGKVLLFQNFNPLVTSADVLEMLKIAFQGVSDAKVLPHEKNFPYATALAIFETRSFTDTALQEVEQNCLVTSYDLRTIIASKVEEPVNSSTFVGHLALDKLKLTKNHRSEDYKNAISTSHCSQPNTIEYEMAMEWRHHEAIKLICRNELFKKQRMEMESLRKGKKS